ncbi:hypothetical protein ACHAQI_001925 [Fusarium lateritium]
MADSSPDGISAQAEFKAGQMRAGAERSNAKQRASLACVPCRSKHVKCDGLLPQCTRCKEEEKPCRYVSSRRGIRDPKKRSMMKDGTMMTDQDDMTESTPSPSLAGSDIFTPQLRPHAARRSKQPIDLYYDHFHVAHPWLPPRETMDHYCETNPDALQFLMATVLYIGSLYSEPRGKTVLRQQAYHMSHEPLPTLWSVQALLSLSIAAFGERHNYVPMFNRALQIALRLGLQHKWTADGYTDPILAESCRRTYWGLYIHESLLNIRASPFHSLVYPLETIAGTELPCEEWEYQARNIPAPVSLDQYDRSDIIRGYSSWAYFVDIIRIRDRYMIPFLHGWGEADPNLLKNANHHINTWRFRISDWKLHRLDKDGMVDTILYHALVVSYG